MDTPAGRRVVARHRPARPSRVGALAPILAGLMLAILAATPAFAHAEVASSNPDDGAVLAVPPTAISVTFTEGVVASKSSITLEGASGEVASAAPAEDGAIVIRLGGLSLLPGDYTIRWTAAARDGHIERGTIAFTVGSPSPTKPLPTASPSAGPAAAPSADTPAAPDGSAAASPAGTASPVPSPSAAPGVSAASTGDVLLPIMAGLVLVGLVGTLVLRRSRGV